jgi:hypothetical protein
MLVELVSKGHPAESEPKLLLVDCARLGMASIHFLRSGKNCARPIAVPLSEAPSKWMSEDGVRCPLPRREGGPEPYETLESCFVPSPHGERFVGRPTERGEGFSQTDLSPDPN